MSHRPLHPYPRNVRVGVLIQEEIASWLLEEADAPWNTATITRVEVARDMTVATVWLLLHETDEAAAAELLKYAGRFAGALRGRLGRNLRMRRVPQLKFKYDYPYAEAARVEGLLFQLRDATPAAVHAEEPAVDPEPAS